MDEYAGLRRAFHGAIVLDPIGDAAVIMADVLIAESLEQADRLLAERSGPVPAIDGNFLVEIRQNLAGLGRDVGDGQAP